MNDTNLFVYCRNNPVSSADKDGEWVNLVVGAVVGALIGGATTAITNYIQTGSVDWGSVAISAAVGAVGGLVSASGLGAVAQAGVSAAINGAGNFADQCHSKGVRNVNYLDVAGNAVLGGAVSLAGTGLGKAVGKTFNKTGTALLSKGRDKLLIGNVRRAVGQSHSSYIRQGYKYILHVGQLK